MKELFLKWVYKNNREFFFNHFIEETLGEIPQDVSEPAMAFLANGRERVIRWSYYWIHLIQARISTDKADIQHEQGMILMLKILITLIRRQTKPQAEQRGEVEKPKVDHAKKVEEAIDEFKKGGKK